eukprot:Partr_v1_DN27104_c2_g1_i1_m16174 putative molybdenum cofactor biosynthesis protein
MKIGILVVSDRGFEDRSYDKSSHVITEWIRQNWPQDSIESIHYAPDSIPSIKEEITSLCERGVELLLTTGGTGFAPRDVTPEAVRECIDREAPGLVSLIMHKSIEITPFAALSRAVAGVRGATVILTLPGSPKACRENLDIVKVVLRHAVELAGGAVISGAHYKSPSPTSNGDGSVHPTSIPAIQTEVANSEAKFSECMCSSSDSFDIASRPRQSAYPLVTYETALDIVLESVESPLASVTLKIDSANLPGSILAEDVRAFREVPAFNSSYVDGYAIVDGDKESKNYKPYSSYEVVGSSCAGASEITNFSLFPGQAIRVNTGCVVPKSAQSIVMVEETVLTSSDANGNETAISIAAGVDMRKGRNIRWQGSDLTAGEVILRKGHKLSSTGTDVALLMSCGVSSIETHRKPIVGVLSTGDEVCEYFDSQPLPTGKVYDTNRPLLLAYLRQFCTVVDLGIASDDRKLLKNNIKESLGQVDVLITTGGVSMGEKDYIKPVLEELDAKVHFGRVALKPGKPTTFATIKHKGCTKYFFGLPGNPVSAVVTSFLIVNAVTRCNIMLEDRAQFLRASAIC